MTPRRPLLLATAACLVLAFGMFVRSRLERGAQSTPPAPLSEAVPLQQLSQEGQLRRAASFVAERTDAVARFVRHVSPTGVSGVRWRGDTLLSVDTLGGIHVSRIASADSGSPPIRALGDSARNGWMLVAARAATGRMLSVAGSFGGRARTGCAGTELTEMLLDVPLSPLLLGGGVFDLDGTLVGMIVRCERRMMAVPVQELERLLAREDSAHARPVLFGMQLAELDSATSAYLASDSGLLVESVRRGSAADGADIQPGDLLLAIDGRPLSTIADLAGVEGLASSTVHELTRLRGKRRTQVRLSAVDSGPAPRGEEPTLGIGLAPAAGTRGVAVASVQRGSSAFRAGLRPGDHLVRVGPRNVSSLDDAERLLRATGRQPVFIVFERDGVAHGVLVSP